MPGCLLWLCNPKAKVSAHYVIDKTGSIYNLVKCADRAWHVGEANGFTIGAEHEGKVEDSTWVTSELWEASIKLFAFLCIEYNIPVSNIIGHNDPLLKKYKNNHTDPGKFWDMVEYKKRVQEEVNKIGKAPP